MIRTMLGWIAFLILTTIAGICGTSLSLISPKKVVPYVVRPWARLMLLSCDVKVNVEGIENVPKGPCVIMFNHQSIFDVLAYMAVLPIDWRAVMKKEVGRMPFIGWVSMLSGHYLVARDGSAGDTREVKKIVKNLRSGPAVVLAPEGTRSPDGKLLPFQKGGFFIALLARVPLVTMVITGGREIRSKGSRWINPTDMSVKIFPPIKVDDLPPGRIGREELMSMVRSQMQGVLDEYESSEAS